MYRALVEQALAPYLDVHGNRVQSAAERDELHRLALHQLSPSCLSIRLRGLVAAPGEFLGQLDLRPAGGEDLAEELEDGHCGSYSCLCILYSHARECLFPGHSPLSH